MREQAVGPRLRGGASLVPLFWGLTYDGETASGDPGRESTTSFVLGGEGWIGLGYWLPTGQRLGLDGGFVLAHTLVGGDDLPLVDLTFYSRLFLGPSLALRLRNGWELEPAARFVILGLGGSQIYPHAGADNVVKFGAHCGGQARIGALRRLGNGPWGLRFGLEGGAQFAESQRSYDVGLTLGVQLGR